MNALLQRAQLLFQQDRYEAAVDAARQVLVEDPENADAHQLLAMCLVEQDKYGEATDHAQQAIALDPADPFSHYTLSVVLLRRNRLKEAERAVEQAVALAPWLTAAHALRAQIYFRQNRWQEALFAANEGLAIEGDDATCLNIRAMAEIKLGKSGTASGTLQDALERDPDNPLTHANQGWLALERGKYREAEQHFLEALRLDPTLDYARAGIVESLKARNFVYRWLLYFFLWMAKFPPQVQFGLLVGGYLGFLWISSLAERRPELSMFLMPLIVAYVVFALMTWLASPLFNLLLRLNPIGKYALSADQRKGANVLLVALVVAAAVLGTGLIFGTWRSAALAGLYAVLIALPASAVYACDRGWPRKTAWGIVAALALIGAPAIAVIMLQIDPKSVPVVVLLAVYLSLRAFPWAVLLSQFAVNYLVQAEVRR